MPAARAVAIGARKRHARARSDARSKPAASTSGLIRSGRASSVLRAQPWGSGACARATSASTTPVGAGTTSLLGGSPRPAPPAEVGRSRQRRAHAMARASSVVDVALLARDVTRDDPARPRASSRRLRRRVGGRRSTASCARSVARRARCRNSCVLPALAARGALASAVAALVACRRSALVRPVEVRRDRGSRPPSGTT